MESHFILTDRDNELLGSIQSRDPLGLLAIWSERGRDLVPHLTIQTWNIKGFQILIEAYRLWESFKKSHSKQTARIDDFFILVEQAFASVRSNKC